MSKYALFSVYDKRTIGPFASAVVDAGYVIAATPGYTFCAYLRDNQESRRAQRLPSVL